MNKDIQLIWEAYQEGHLELVKFPEEDLFKRAETKFFSQGKDIIHHIDRDMARKLGLLSQINNPFLIIKSPSGAELAFYLVRVADDVVGHERIYAKYTARDTSSHPKATGLYQLSQGTPDDVIDWWQAELADLSGDPGQGREPTDPGEGIY